MKHTYLFLFAFFTVFISQSQIIDIPDENFKLVLALTQCVDTDNDGIFDSDVDLNDDGEIQVSEAEAVQSLRIIFNNIQSIDGIDFFVNLQKLENQNNPINEVDLSLNINLKELKFANANLTTLDLSQNIELEYLDCSNNQITSLSDLTVNPALEYVNCSNNQINSLALNTPNSLLKELICSINNISLLTLINLNLLEKLNVSSNQLSEIDVTQNQNLTELSISSNSISGIDLSQNISLEILSISYTTINEVDLTNFNNLQEFFAYECPITQLDVSQNSMLRGLNLNGTQLDVLDVTNNLLLEELRISNTNITSIDLSLLSELTTVNVAETPMTSLSVNNSPQIFSLILYGSLIENLFIKNGSSISNNVFFPINDMPNLTYICADEFEFSSVQSNLNANGYSNVQLNSFCSFAPGGEFFTIQGENKIDTNTNGCDVNDPVFPFMKFSINSSSDGGTVVASESGSYNIPLQEGAHELTPQFEHPSYYMVSPASVIVDFPSDSSPFTQDFCITPNGDFNDLEIVIIPLQQARPGFDTDYKLTYKNKGTTILSGSVDLAFTDDVMSFVSSSPVVDDQIPNQLSWNYIDLQPFETRAINFTMNLNTPTDANFPLNGDDVLDFVTTISSSDLDETPNDNVFTLNQTVVNSFDPNDKTCLEGDFIREEMVGEYVHYMIRFENTGTANAVNVVIKDEIDTSKYDISTIIPLDASHDFVTRIQNANNVEFIFENIDLPFDDANNDGYVVFKIKTLETLAVGDTFSNDAEIYFDFNFPIITNDYTTTVEDNLSIVDQELSAGVKMFPNPVSDKLFINSEVNIEKASIYDVNGRLLKTIVFYGNEIQRSVDLEALSVGVYVIKLSSNTSESTQKFIKE
ncbi:leucine-rich repeat domain-containing protein [Psychroserpens sp. Hel_I_66]|uniref:T9SS type A sorting domain-containing protein n=1 Tax=Psychroserpens sp. Hel_I_66 TaxID=1250004 RepID=UPI0006477A8F|nr:leucine-rich repeat domain-containing protein [Psychroserpens sp. Hel_I_66]